MKFMVFVIVILTAVPAFAQGTGTQDAAKVIDGFFNGIQNFSGCDSSDCNAIPLTDRTIGLRRVLRGSRD